MSVVFYNDGALSPARAPKSCRTSASRSCGCNMNNELHNYCVIVVFVRTAPTKASAEPTPTKCWACESPAKSTPKCWAGVVAVPVIAAPETVTKQPSKTHT